MVQPSAADSPPEALVIGDDPGVCGRVGSVLAGRGYQVSRCQTLEEGRGSFRNQPVVVAQIAPGSNGEVSRFVAFLRERCRGVGPIVVGIGTSPPEGGARANGLNEFFTPDVDAQRLLSCLPRIGGVCLPPRKGILEKIFTGGSPSSSPHPATGRQWSPGGKASQGTSPFFPAEDNPDDAPELAPTPALAAPAENPTPVPSIPQHPPRAQLPEAKVSGTSVTAPGTTVDPRPAQQQPPVPEAGAQTPVPPAAMDDPAGGPQSAPLRAFLEHAPLAMALFDRGMRYLTANRLWRKEFHLEETAIVGRSQYDVFPDLHPSWRKIYERCLEGHVERCDEDIFQRPDGSHDWVRWEVRPWGADGERPDGLIVSCEVITRFKQAQRKLRFESQFASTVLENPSAPVMVLDRSGRVLRANPAARALAPCNHLVENAAPYWDQIFCGDARTAASDLFARLGPLPTEPNGGSPDASPSLPNTITETVELPDGPRIIRWTNLPQLADDGQIASFVRIGQDVTGDAPPPAPATEAGPGPAFEALPDPAWLCDRRGQLTHANAAWCALRGLDSPESDLGKRWMRAFPQRDRETLAAMIAEAINRHEPFSYHCHFLAAEDRPVPVLFKASPITAADGTFVGLAGSAADVSDLQSLESSIQELRKELAAAHHNLDRALTESQDARPAAPHGGGETAAATTAITEHAPFGILLVDTEGKVEYANPQHRKLLGSDAHAAGSVPEWLAGHCADAAHAARVREVWDDRIWRKQVTRVLPLLNERKIIKDIEFHPTLLDDGRLLLTLTDVTESHRSEEALRASESRLRALVRDLGIPVATVDRTGDIASSSRAFDDLLGYSAMESRRLRIDDCLNPADLAQKDRLLARLNGGTNRPGTANIKARRRDGTLVPVELRASHVLDDSGSVTLTAFVFTPLPPEPNPNTGPAHDVAEAGPDAGAPKVRALHHQARNNLQIISSLLNLQHDHLSEPSTRAALAAGNNRLHAVAFVHQQLAAGDPAQPVELGALCRDLVAHLRDNLLDESARGRIRTTVDAGTARVGFSTATTLALVINELVTNAFQHAFPEGTSGMVEVEARISDDGSGFLAVRDDGVGLPSGFDPANTSGLGFRVIRTLAQQLGAKVSVADDDETEIRVGFGPAAAA